MTIRNISVVGMCVVFALSGCSSVKVPGTGGPTFESRHLYDMRLGEKPPSGVGIDLGGKPALTDIQKLALEGLARDESRIVPEVRTRVYEHYADVKRTLEKHFPSNDPALALIMPDIRNGTEIDALVTLIAIEVAQDGRRILLMYHTEWDVEHGLNILLLDGTIERVGLGVDVFLPVETPAP